MSQKIANYAFIDSQNLNLGIQRMGWKLDWRKFRRLLKDKYNVERAYMFIGYMSENESLYEYMHELGYLVVLKPTIDVSNNSDHEKSASGNIKQDGDKEKDRPMVKGNVDAELVLYTMKELNNYGQAIIVSGDGDFFSLVEYLDDRDKLANVMAPNWQYSSLLRPYEEKIIRLDKMKRQLSYRTRKSNQS
jgi:uncharacterized LabA/DUF88 family protein